MKLQVHANAEVGLPDQLRRLSNRIKHLEKQMMLTEEQRLRISSALDMERELRHQQCDPRTLTGEEKSLCKACVNALMAAAKESLSRQSSSEEVKDSAGGSINGANQPSEADMREAEALIEQSQEELYAKVEKMDKAVLMELCAALGGLVQSMYIDREKARQEELLRQQRKAQAKAEKEARLKEEEDKRKKAEDEKQSQTVGAVAVAGGAVTTLHKASDSKDEQPLTNVTKQAVDEAQLSEATMQMLRNGIVCLKASRFGSRQPRLVFLSHDGKSLCWKRIESTGEPTKIKFETFTS